MVPLFGSTGWSTEITSKYVASSKATLVPSRLRNTPFRPVSSNYSTIEITVECFPLIYLSTTQNGVFLNLGGTTVASSVQAYMQHLRLWVVLSHYRIESKIEALVLYWWNLKLLILCHSIIVTIVTVKRLPLLIKRYVRKRAIKLMIMYFSQFLVVYHFL